MEDRTSPDYCLDDLEVRRLAGGDCGFLLHSDLANFQTLEDALGGHSAAAILYQIRGPADGHWTMLVRHSPTEVEIFDPYPSEGPDCEYIGRDYYQATGQGQPRLAELIAADPRIKTVHFNDQPLQEKAPGLNTCGRWAGLRGLFRGLSYGKFARKFGSLSDEEVTRLTNGLF